MSPFNQIYVYFVILFWPSVLSPFLRRWEEMTITQSCCRFKIGHHPGNIRTAEFTITINIAGGVEPCTG
jgi:hypothetical protein